MTKSNKKLKHKHHLLYTNLKKKLLPLGTPHRFPYALSYTRSRCLESICRLDHHFGIVSAEYDKPNKLGLKYFKEEKTDLYYLNWKCNLYFIHKVDSISKFNSRLIFLIGSYRISLGQESVESNDQPRVLFEQIFHSFYDSNSINSVKKWNNSLIKQQI